MKEKTDRNGSLYEVSVRCCGRQTYKERCRPIVVCDGIPNGSYLSQLRYRLMFLDVVTAGSLCVGSCGLTPYVSRFSRSHCATANYKSPYKEFLKAMQPFVSTVQAVSTMLGVCIYLLSCAGAPAPLLFNTL